MKEAEAQRAILDYLRLKGHFFWRNNTGAFRTSWERKDGSYGENLMRFGTAGSPDIIGCVNGQFVGIEVKGPRGRLSPAQEAFRDMLTDAGGKHIEARSIDDVVGAGL